MSHSRDFVYHVAEKNIPSVAGPAKGVKLETFIFDAFEVVHGSSPLVAPSFALLWLLSIVEFLRRRFKASAWSAMWRLVCWPLLCWTVS